VCTRVLNDLISKGKRKIRVCRDQWQWYVHAIHMGGPRAFFDRRQNEYGFSARKSTGLTRPVRQRTGQEIAMLTKRNFFHERVMVPWEGPTSAQTRRQVKPYSRVAYSETLLGKKYIHICIYIYSIYRICMYVQKSFSKKSNVDEK